MSIHALFLNSIIAKKASTTTQTRRRSAALEDQGNQQNNIAQFEPIERNKEGFHESGVDDRSDPDRQIGEPNPLRNNDDQDHIGEMQAAAEAIQDRIRRARKQKAALEDIAEQLEETIPEGGVSEKTAEMVQTALGASEIPEIQDVIATESFSGDRVTATINLSNTLRARAMAMGHVIDRFQRKMLD